MLKKPQSNGVVMECLSYITEVQRYETLASFILGRIVEVFKIPIECDSLLTD